MNKKTMMLMRPEIDTAWSIFRDFHKRPGIVRNSFPIIFFGDLQAYLDPHNCRFLTVGKNPSAKEFDNERFERIEGHVNLANYKQHYEDYLLGLSDYFRVRKDGKDHVFHEWFDGYEEVLNQYNASYYTNTKKFLAVHIDLYSPLGTEKRWTKTPRRLRNDLKERGIRLWDDLIRALKPDVIIASLGRKHLDKMIWRTLHDFPARRRGRSHYPIKGTKLNMNKKCVTLIAGTLRDRPFDLLSRSEKSNLGTLTARYVSC